MSWLGLVLLVLGAYLAYRLVGVLLKLLMFVLALVGAYWFLAPHMDWPTVSELVYVLGPDFGGRRIEEVVQPRAIAGEVTDRVVDGVIDRILPPQPMPEVEPLPEPALAPAQPGELSPAASDPSPDGEALEAPGQR